MVWAYSSVVEHYVDIVGVPSSNLGTPTIEAFRGSKKPAESAGFFYAQIGLIPEAVGTPTPFKRARLDIGGCHKPAIDRRHLCKRR